MTKFISLSSPYIFGNEKKYVNECIDTEWVSTAGKYVEIFEEKIKTYTKSKYAIACISGTSALHISLLLSGTTKNTEVIVPTMGFIAPINAISYCGGKPIFMDVDNEYGLDVEKTISFIENETIFKKNITINKRSNKKITALIVIHIYGRTVNFEKLEKICKKRNIMILEDAAEALGNFILKGKNKNKHVGTVGTLGCLSFNGNKIITSGGGGMILTNNKNLALKAKLLTTQAKKDPIFFIHDEIGYNYRLTNIQAAVGVGQIENIKKVIKLKKNIYLNYKKLLSNKKNINFKSINNFATSNYWLNLVEIKPINKNNSLKKIINLLKKNNIESRPIWHLNHLQNKYLKCQRYKIINAVKLVKNTLCLPSSPQLSLQDIKKVVDKLDG